MDIKGITRKNYWDYPLINPLLLPGTPIDAIDAFAHAELSADCCQIFLAGNTEIIFEYVKSDVSAWREPWVIDQVERWRLENTPESRARYERLSRAYFDTHGPRSLQTTVRVILKDHKIFKYVRKCRHQQPKKTLRSMTDTNEEVRGGLYASAALIYRMSEESVEEIYRLYTTKADEVMGTKPPRILSPYFLPKKQYDTVQGALKMLGLDEGLRVPETPPLTTRTSVFRWLDTMAERLRWISGG